MVELSRVSRSGFYRFDENARAGPDRDVDLRDAMQRIALEWPSYGPAAYHPGVATAWMDGEPETGSPSVA